MERGAEIMRLPGTLTPAHLTLPEKVSGTPEQVQGLAIPVSDKMFYTKFREREREKASNLL